ncbi:MAG: PAS domain S-box protein, partial [Bdellovibrionota bacterium]
TKQPEVFEMGQGVQGGGLAWYQCIARPVAPEETFPDLVVVFCSESSRQKTQEERLRQSEERYRQIVEAAEEGVWMINDRAETIFVNQKMAAIFGRTVEEMLGKEMFSFMDKSEEQVARQNMVRRRAGVREQFEFVFRKKDGSKVWTLMGSNPVYDKQGRFAGALAMVTDLTQKHTNEMILGAQKDIFALLVKGESLRVALAVLLRAIEGVIDGVEASVLLTEEDGLHLRTAAAPSLPPEFSRSIDGGAIGPKAGSFGTAAYRKEVVITEDIASDPLWEDFRDLALKHGLRACWSSPILSRDSRVLGTFALYFLVPRRPTALELDLVKDVTAVARLSIEYVQNRDSLANTLSLLNSTIEATADGILVVDTHGSIRSYNHKFLELWRMPKEILAARNDELAQTFVLDQLKDPDAFLSKVRELYLRPEIGSFDVLEFKDGRTFERYSTPQRQDGRIVGRVWSFRDVSVRLKAERKLKESEENFRRLAEAAFEGICIHEKGKILTVNDRFAELFGYSPTELIGMNVTELTHPDFRQLVSQKIREDYEGRYEAQGIRKDGSILWGELRSRAINFRGIRARVTAARDITDWKKAVEERERLLANEKRLRERATLLAEAGKVLGSSLNYEKNFRTIARCVGWHFSGHCTVALLKEDGAILPIGSSAPDHVRAEGLLSAIRSGRSLVEPGAMFVPLLMRDRPIGALQVISSDPERRYEQADLELAEELGRYCAIAIDNANLFRETQRSVGVRDDFISIASHELRTPITPLKMQIQLLRRIQGVESGLGNADPATLNHLLSDSEQQVDRLSKLVDNLLDVSRIRSGRLVLTPEEVDLGKLVMATVTRFSGELESAMCPVSVEAEPGVRGYWDRPRLEQVITNLLTNAYKYGRGKPIEVRVFSTGGSATLTVTDHGIGILPEDHHKLFSRFERIASRKNFVGLGLGLYIAREIVEAHGGRISVQSELGRGATFKVALPQSQKSTFPVLKP